MTDEATLDRVVKYVRGELPEDEAERFEEQYFEDEELARLVEAEQLLQAKLGLAEISPEPETLESQPEAGPPFWHSAWRTYSAAASILFVPALFLLLQSGLRETAIDPAAGPGVLPRLTVSQVRLSTVRSGGDEGPAFAFPLPRDPTEQVDLVIPIPPPLRQDPAGTLSLSLYRVSGAREPTELWSLTRPVGNQREMRVALPGGSLDLGRYRLILGTLAETGQESGSYDFEITAR